jgi:aryl carrier-like protein
MRPDHVDLNTTILTCLRDIAEMTECSLVSPLQDDTVLLESGLDSLGFAMLVSRLEEELGYDPFVQMVEPVYPATLGEFVSIYRKFAPAA